jgi:hypothetical protein
VEIDPWERRAYRTAILVMLVPFGWCLVWAASGSISEEGLSIAIFYLLNIAVCCLFGVDIGVHVYGLVVVGVLGADKRRFLWIPITVLVPPAVFVAVAAAGPQDKVVGQQGMWGISEVPTGATLLVAHFLASILFALGVHMAARQRPRGSQVGGSAGADSSIRKRTSGERWVGDQRDQIYRTR